MRTHSPIQWGRDALAALASEVAVIVVLILITTTYRFLLAPGKSAADYQAFSDLAGYYFAPPAAGLAAFFGALWATRKLSSGFLVNGTLVGVFGVLLTGGFFFVTKPENRLMYVVSFVLRILGGYLGGVLAQRISARRSLSPLPA